jgi:hypothetical protein
VKGVAVASQPYRVGEMAKEKTQTKKKTEVKILDRKKIMSAREIRVVVKGGKLFTFKISRPLLDGRKLILYDERGVVVMVTSLNKLPRDIEEYFERSGMEPLYIYPANQLPIV